MGELNEHPKPSIYDFVDYREFIHATISILRIRGKFSARKFAEEVGFKSCGYMTMVLKRQRNLSTKSAQKVADGLTLSKEEADFFHKLVAFNQSQNPATKDKAYQELFFCKKFKSSRQVDADQYEFFSHWSIVALLEAFGTSLGQASAADLAQALKVDVQDIEHGIEVLSRLKFIERDGMGWRKLEPTLETEPFIRNITVRKFHREMISKALDTIDTLPPSERELGSLTISLSEANFDEVKRRIFQFHQDLNALFSEDPNPEKIYQLNFQFFPLARVKV